MPKKEIVVTGRKVLPSLVDLCIKTAIDNLRYLGDVGETDLDLLDQILPHCTVDQLMHVEKCSKVRKPAFCVFLLLLLDLSRNVKIYVLLNVVGKRSESSY